MKYVVLARKWFRGRHTADNIVQEYEDIIQSYNIASKISTIVTDNVSNIVKGFSLPEFKTIAVDSTADNSDEEDDIDSIITVAPEEYERFPADHSPCFCHTTQLVVSDGFKEAGQLNRVLGSLQGC